MQSGAPSRVTTSTAEIGRDGIVWRWSLLVFISGFLIVALQIVWYRLIGVLLQSNGYSFSLVLAVFLLGDAAGLLVGARTIDRISDPRRFFFLMQGVATALALGGRLVRLPRHRRGPAALDFRRSRHHERPRR